MTSQTHANGWHMLRAGLFLAAAAALIFLGSSLLKSLAPEAQTARMWVQVVWFLASGALLWVGFCHLLQPLIRLIGVHIISVTLLVFWSAVLLYFYYTGRVAQYLPDDGLFRPLMLIGGIGMGVLGIFNLLVGRSQGDDCCGHDHHDHDHGHGHHDHAHHHDHDHSHGCGHDHGEPHDHGQSHHDHVHKHDEECCGGGHEHHHHHHAPEPAQAHGHEHAHHHHDHECCGHHHEHDHGHSHGPANTCHGEDLLAPAHDHSHAAHDHSHGILTSNRWFNQSSAVLVLLAPLALAAAYSPDQYSQTAVMNKNLYNQTYGVGARAEQFSLKKNPGQNSLPPVAAATTPTTTDMPPPANDADKVPGAPNAGANAKAAQAAGKPTGAAETQSYGSFTLADLEQQVPRNKDGNFELNVPEIYYTAGDAEVQKAITGQPIETVAQVLPEKVNNESGHRLRVFRMLVQCCAADARPYSVPVDFGKKAPEFKDMTWVRVKGTLTFPKEGDQIVPVIEAKSIEETTAPDDAMLY